MIITTTETLPLFYSTPLQPSEYTLHHHLRNNSSIIIRRHRPQEIPRESAEKCGRYAALYPSLQRRPASNFPSLSPSSSTAKERKEADRPLLFTLVPPNILTELSPHRRSRIIHSIIPDPSNDTSPTPEPVHKSCDTSTADHIDSILTDTRT